MSETAITILINNLEAAARRAGYLEHRMHELEYESAEYEQDSKEHEAERLYTLRLTKVVREVALGRIDPDVALGEDFAYREKNNIEF